MVAQLLSSVHAFPSQQAVSFLLNSTLFSRQPLVHTPHCNVILSILTSHSEPICCNSKHQFTALRKNFVHSYFAHFLLLTRSCYDAETNAIQLLLKRAFA